MVFLVGTNGLVRELPLGRTTIGRSSDNDISLDESSCSKNHAVITNNGLVNGSWSLILEDLGSTNGTRVGANPSEFRRISAPEPLEIAEYIQFGFSKSWFQVLVDRPKTEDFEEILTIPSINRTPSTNKEVEPGGGGGENADSTSGELLRADGKPDRAHELDSPAGNLFRDVKSDSNNVNISITYPIDQFRGGAPVSVHIENSGGGKQTDLPAASSRSKGILKRSNLPKELTFEGLPELEPEPDAELPSMAEKTKTVAGASVKKSQSASSHSQLDDPPLNTTPNDPAALRNKEIVEKLIQMVLGTDVLPQLAVDENSFPDGVVMEALTESMVDKNTTTKLALCKIDRELSELLTQCEKGSQFQTEATVSDKIEAAFTELFTSTLTRSIRSLDKCIEGDLLKSIEQADERGCDIPMRQLLKVANWRLSQLLSLMVGTLTVVLPPSSDNGDSLPKKISQFSNQTIFFVASRALDETVRIIRSVISGLTLLEFKIEDATLPQADRQNTGYSHHEPTSLPALSMSDSLHSEQFHLDASPTKKSPQLSTKSRSPNRLNKEIDDYRSLKKRRNLMQRAVDLIVDVHMKFVKVAFRVLKSNTRIFRGAIRLFNILRNRFKLSCQAAFFRWSRMTAVQAIHSTLSGRLHASEMELLQTKSYLYQLSHESELVAAVEAERSLNREHAATNIQLQQSIQELERKFLEITSNETGIFKSDAARNQLAVRDFLLSREMAAAQAVLRLRELRDDFQRLLTEQNTEYNRVQSAPSERTRREDVLPPAVASFGPSRQDNRAGPRLPEAFEAQSGRLSPERTRSANNNSLAQTSLKATPKLSNFRKESSKGRGDRTFQLQLPELSRELAPKIVAMEIRRLSDSLGASHKKIQNLRNQLAQETSTSVQLSQALHGTQCAMRRKAVCLSHLRNVLLSKYGETGLLSIMKDLEQTRRGVSAELQSDPSQHFGPFEDEDSAALFGQDKSFLGPAATSNNRSASSAIDTWMFS